ncbi:tetratricopeptide repeat protein [bacterium]|nr:tetratricopeptide repeat protein [bacterium]
MTVELSEKIKDENSWEFYVDKLYKLCTQGNYTKAVEVCEIGLSKAGRIPILLSYMGYILYEMKQYENAIKYYTESIKIDDFDHLSFYYRGLCYYGLQNYEMAIKDSNSVLEIIEISSKAYYLRSISEKELNQKEKALSDIDMAIKYDPENQLYKDERDLILKM